MSKFKVGDKVKVIASTWGPNSRTRAMIGSVYVIKEINDGICAIGTPDFAYWFNPSDLRPFKKTLKDVEAGDVVLNEHGNEFRVVEALNNVFAYVTTVVDHGGIAWMEFSEAEEYGWKLKDAEPETIEINGKKYNKEDVVERLAELEEL
ncbi:MAG TPA: hypothetical protein VJ841_03460 [Candidatus Saccharimonadales bacterium]|nr:hypothetical protein [Candidatus Saccharimonadales bacterium]